jgi:ParB-like chromosome segregation protein Spo0J
MQIHPLANLFPMMGPEELDDLAANIKANGQLHPILVNNDGRLIDGRIRSRACEIAGVEPQFKKINGHDPRS